MSITLLDGGMGQELIARAGQATDLWSVQALLDSPEMVSEVHNAYFAAGAEVATTNTYSVLPDRLQNHGLEDQFETLQRRACELALDARAAHGAGLVAGSLGPLGFSYRPDLAPPAPEAAITYGRICAIQANYVDVFLAETMSSVDQARGAILGAQGFGKPVWVAFSVDDKDGRRLRSGEDILAAAELVREMGVDAVLVNCSTPEAVSQALPAFVDSGLPVGAYANGFVEIAKDFNKFGATVDMLSARQDLTPMVYADFVDEWVNMGASIVGGCCEVGPRHISLLAERYHGAGG
ncbi:homocysteine S-methyltransferase [Amylibacter marinus]|uniref:Homocysteine S-methyltransferase n=1 Tax=Amylibacter marinus TaxID=1475483 RepID=A0ABQ5VWX6_9RHOB|nr:homocysteine S-methyltransferase family protein [Amylibacter marinus]GLQ35702.1 homocysteine S-methyltransferase [Amylibacter marinus]